MQRKRKNHRRMNSLCRLICFSLVCVFFLASVLPCIAEEPSCRLTVTPETADKATVNDLTVTICMVAEKVDGRYLPTADFAESGISVSGLAADPSAEKAASIHQHVLEHELIGRSVKTAIGRAVFPSLDKGIYLVYCPSGQQYSFKPFLVVLPQMLNGLIQYEVTSSPKTEEPTTNSHSVYVLKRWDDDNDKAGKRPDEVTVLLKHEGKAVASVILSEENGWAHTFTDLSVDGGYTVEEKSVEYYTAAYNGDEENGFVITNKIQTDKLPQTGQMWWPIWLIAIIGIGFVVLGVIELKGKKDETTSS